MRTATFFFLGLIAMCLAGVILIGRAPGPETVIRIGLLGSVEDEDYFGSQALKAHVEEATEGRIGVEIYPSGQFCGNERECLEQLQSGVLDVFMTTIGGLGNVYGPGQVFDLPYVFEDDTVAECVFDGPIVDKLRQAIFEEDLAMRLMVVSNTGGWRNFATTRRPVQHPGDLQGLKLRTTSAPIQQELTRRLGATPTPIAWSELYTALGTGVVDGTKNGVQDIVGMNFHDSINYMVLDRHAYMGALWWLSEVTWQDLSPEDRAILEAGFADLKTITRAIPKEREADAYTAFRARGGVVHTPSPDQRAAFERAAGGMRDWFEDRYGEDWLMALDDAVFACTL